MPDEIRSHDRPYVHFETKLTVTRICRREMSPSRPIEYSIGVDCTNSYEATEEICSCYSQGQPGSLTLMNPATHCNTPLRNFHPDPANTIECKAVGPANGNLGGQEYEIVCSCLEGSAGNTLCRPPSPSRSLSQTSSQSSTKSFSPSSSPSRSPSSSYMPSPSPSPSPSYLSSPSPSPSPSYMPSPSSSLSPSPSNQALRPNSNNTSSSNHTSLVIIVVAVVVVALLFSIFVVVMQKKKKKKQESSREAPSSSS